MNNSRAEIMASLQKASSLSEQMALVSELEALDARQASNVAQARSIDLAGAIVEQTLSPVRVHEFHTASTDWLSMDDDNNDAGYHQAVMAKAALWFGKVSPEVKSDRSEFVEQARGIARRTASAYGVYAPAAEETFLHYVAFLNREAASGLDQIDQTTAPDGVTYKPTEYPAATFPTFEDAVHPINEQAVAQEGTYNNPLLAEIDQLGQGQGQAEWPPVPGGGTAGVTSVAISHAYNLDEFKQREAASTLDQITQTTAPDGVTYKPTPLPGEVAYPWILGGPVVDPEADDQDFTQAAPAAIDKAVAARKTAAEQHHITNAMNHLIDDHGHNPSYMLSAVHDDAANAARTNRPTSVGGWLKDQHDNQHTDPTIDHWHPGDAEKNPLLVAGSDDAPKEGPDLQNILGWSVDPDDVESHPMVQHLDHDHGFSSEFLPEPDPSVEEEDRGSAHEEAISDLHDQMHNDGDADHTHPGRAYPMGTTASRKVAGSDNAPMGDAETWRSHTLDNPEGDEYKVAPKEHADALNARFEMGSGPVVWHPTEPNTLVHGPDNFWDGPRHVKVNGDGTYEYTNPYAGQIERFDSSGKTVDTATRRRCPNPGCNQYGCPECGGSGHMSFDQSKALDKTSRKTADMYGNSDMPHAVPQPGVANSPATTPQPQQGGSYMAGFAAGMADGVSGDAATYADNSAGLPFAQGYVEGYTKGFAQLKQTRNPKDVPRSAGGDSGQEFLSGTATRKIADARKDPFFHSPGTLGKDHSHEDPRFFDTNAGLEKGVEGNDDPSVDNDWYARGVVIADHLIEDHNLKPNERWEENGDASDLEWTHRQLHNRGTTATRKTSSLFTPKDANKNSEFNKAYKFASKWDASKPLVRTGSAEFEAGLYAGISDNIGSQDAWVAKHGKQAAKYPEFSKRIALHKDFSLKVIADQGGIMKGAYLRVESATSTDLDTLAPSASPSPVGETPINGPGRPGPLAGGMDPAAPAGAAPYNGAEPFGQGVVPGGISTATPATNQLSDPRRLAAFRQRVQSSLKNL